MGISPIEDYIFYYGEGVEIGWPLLYKLIHIITPNLSILEISNTNFIICSILFLIWLEYNGLRTFSNKDKNIILAFILVFSNINVFGTAQRQSLSIIFLLFSLSNRKTCKFYIYLSIATIFHITSLPIGLIYSFLMKKQYNRILILITFIFFFILSMNFHNIINIITENHIIGGLSEKARFYTHIHTNSIVYRELMYISIIFLGIVFNWKTIESEWKNIIVFIFISYISLLNFYLLSTRLNIVLCCLIGYFLYIVFKPRFFIISYFIFFLGLLHFILTKSSVFFSLATDPYWAKYPIFDLNPFYFFYR
ncbi:EpsG family protein [Photorhabdus sp. RM71S]|uniref:EpsG family protein n=1 Tax=Photorhabdus sp. RM71S TaxID=3342824 RepID=UPI0036D8DC3F